MMTWSFLTGETALEPKRMRLWLSGRLRFKLRAFLILIWSGLSVAVRRLLRRPLLPSWGLVFEASTKFQRSIYQAVYSLPDMVDAREMVDALHAHSASLDRVAVEPVSRPVQGAWFRAEDCRADRVILYCHGAYAFFAASEKGFVADLTVLTGLPIFALDYRHTPKHPFPAQLNDAIAGYRWLLHSGHRPADIVVFGTSAGGNLCLSLLLALRDTGEPLPKLAICLSPWTDVGNSGESIRKNEPFDIIDRGMIEQGAQWLAGDLSPEDPKLSPLRADLSGLPPIYLQAGGREIFIDMIRSFHRKAVAQGVQAELEVWEAMNHVFQAYGDRLPEAREAMDRLATVLREP